MSNEQMAQSILQFTGGKENIRMGELQIDLCPLPADPRVNVVAQVCEPDLALLPYAADPAYQFEFCE